MDKNKLLDIANNLCPICGSELSNQSDELTILVKCPHCSWGMASTKSQSIYDDNIDYEIYVDFDPDYSLQKLKALSQICGSNYLETKMMFETGNVLLLKGKAYKVKSLIHKLKDSQILYHTIPQYPY